MVEAIPYLHCTSSEHLLPRFLESGMDLEHPVRDVWHHCLFAGEIPFIPDIDRELVGETREHQARDILQGQIQFIQSLGQYKDDPVTVGLRFVVKPSESRIRIFVCGKGAARENNACKELGRSLWDDMRRSFPRAYPLEALGNAREFISEVYNPFAFTHVSAIRRRELVTSSGIYVVLPLVWRANSFAELFHTLLTVRAPLLVSVQLRPTNLDDLEREALAYVANRLEELSDQNYQGFSGPQRLVDVEARSASNFYRGFLAQMDQPYLVTVELASPQPLPRGVLHTLGAEISSPSKVQIDVHERDQQHAEQSGTTVDIVSPETRGQEVIARRNLYLLEVDPWGASFAPHNSDLPLGRLRHLVNAREANCVFRVPVPQPDGIDGVPIRSLTPFRPSFGGQGHTPEGALSLGAVIHRGRPSSDSHAVELKEINRHALVVGSTGSGKTAACMYLLDQLWKRFKIPFLVIEPVKSEYRTLMDAAGYEDLQIFTAGDEATSPMRLNPFAFDAGIRMDRHVGGLKSVFTAVLPMVGPLPMLLESCLYQVYADRGWQTSDDGSQGETLGFPTLTDLYVAISGKIDSLDYKGEVRANIEAAGKVRIDSLRTAGKGRMLDVPRSIAFEDLMSKPTVIELKSVGDTDEKSLLAGLLVLRIAEYCEVRSPGGAQEVQHVTVLEEAHRLLRHVPASRGGGEEGDPRGKAVEILCDMLSEIRAYGEGIVIVDQYPSRLAPDAIKNTNLKVMLHLPAEDDRQALGATMRFSEEQTRFSAGLQIGEAAVFSSGMHEPVLVRLPNYKQDERIDGKSVEDARVAESMEAWWRMRLDVLRKYVGCRRCNARATCPYHERVHRISQDADVNSELQRYILSALTGARFRPVVERAGRVLQQKAKAQWTREQLIGAAYCLVCETVEELVREGITEAGVGNREGEELLDCISAAVHAALMDPPDASIDAKVHELAANLFRPVFPPTDACGPCRRQCFFRRPAQRAVKDRAFQEAVNVAHRAKKLPDIVSACQALARRIVAPGDPESQEWAAYCCFLAELERRETADLAGMAELFLRELSRSEETDER